MNRKKEIKPCNKLWYFKKIFKTLSISILHVLNTIVY